MNPPDDFHHWSLYYYNARMADGFRKSAEVSFTGPMTLELANSLDVETQEEFGVIAGAGSLYSTQMSRPNIDVDNMLLKRLILQVSRKL